MSQTDWRNWGNHPFVVGVTVVAALLSIYSYFENRKPSSGTRELVPVEAAQEVTQFQNLADQKKARPILTDQAAHKPDEAEPAPAASQPAVERVDDSVASVAEGGLAITSSRWLGRWEGVGLQFNPQQRWSIQMDLTSESVGTIVGSIRYPSLNCGGDLVLAGVDESTWTMRENITYGGNCLTGGTITIVLLSANRAQWLWYYPQGELGAQAEVRKQ